MFLVGMVTRAVTEPVEVSRVCPLMGMLLPALRFSGRLQSATGEERGYLIPSPLPLPGRARRAWRDIRQCRRLPGLHLSSNHDRERWQYPARG